jgi:hypothetical protein
VHRGLPAPQIVVVHRRQIVVHERIAVHAFERGTDHQRAFPRHVEQGGGFDHQKRPNSFSRAQARVTNRIEQPFRPKNLVLAGRRGQETIQQPVGFRRCGTQTLRKRRRKFGGQRHDRTCRARIA